jgi:hypothetical protein
MNLLRRLASLFRRKPAMIGTPPSASQVPLDPGLHARDFVNRYAIPLDRYCAIRMQEVGIAEARIGSSDHKCGIPWCAFNPHEATAGGVATAGRITMDSGVLNPEKLAALGFPAADAWRRSRLRDRIDATIAHEDMEYRTGSHEAAVDLAPETDLPIGEAARALLRAIRLGERSIRGGGASPNR